MKVTELWLKDWINSNLSYEETAKRLTMAGLEVEAIEPVAGAFTGVVVAQVIETKPHPDADKLTLCLVDVGLDTPIDVVCGARNVRPGLKVALAQIGAKLPGDFVIKATKLRGQPSQGMLCSYDELGMSDDAEGIIELPEDAPIGVDLRVYLGLEDCIYDVSLTPNRADCFSVLGIARELSALTGAPLVLPAVELAQPTIATTMPVHIEASEACPRYAGRVITAINPHAKTPLWMTERLRRVGLRSIHPTVDITNYVMLELGQPLHAFDLSAITGQIQVRMGHPSESLTLLDNQTIALTAQELVIADKEKPLALAGVMGGLSSGVHENTTQIFLESAFFKPEVISGTARRFGLSSDAAMRFERGVDYNLPLRALNRASQLMVDLLGAKLGPITEVHSASSILNVTTIDFNPTLVKRLSGLEIELNTMRNMLLSLGLEGVMEGDLWKVNVPSHRFDLKIAQDLVEEIIRLYGYDNITAMPLLAPVTAGQLNPREALMEQLGQFFKSRGYHETITYSFVDPQLQTLLFEEKPSLELLNPISSDLSQMRVSLWPGLIAALHRNVHRQQLKAALFETGVIFDVQASCLTEKGQFAALLWGETGTYDWLSEKRDYDFFDLKGDVDAFFDAIGLKGQRYVQAQQDNLHPGMSASIFLNEIELGKIGVLHPKITEALDISKDVVLISLDINALLNVQPKKLTPISKFPQIRRDLSFLVDKNIAVGEILETIQATHKQGWLKQVEVFDVYMGSGVPEGQKSIAVAMILQPQDKTLVDLEINSEIDAIIQVLREKFSITLRD